jgi:precorrin-4/cobalt-precorrin-4 C11-methyltransferase
MAKVYFIGAGPGDPELITLKAVKKIKECETVIYAGSLVSKDILVHCTPTAEIHNSAPMNLEEITAVISKAVSENKNVARLHTGDPSIYGAIGEQMAELDKLNIDYEVIPGVTALFASAAALKAELTLPEISQTVIISRAEGRTPVPADETIEKLSAHGGTFCFYLSVDKFKEIRDAFVKNGWSEQTPTAVVYRASWKDELIIKGTLNDMQEKITENNIKQHALVIIGKSLGGVENYSKLYDRNFTHGTRS